jgi:hypothetical protein
MMPAAPFNLGGKMRHAIASLIVLFAIPSGGAFALLMLGALSEARQLSYSPFTYGFYKYLAITCVTLGVYRVARAYATAPVPALFNRPETWRAWAYLRWVIISGLTALVFVAMTTDEAQRTKRAEFFLQCYAALLIVGACGTHAGVKEVALKQGADSKPS